MKYANLEDNVVVAYTRQSPGLEMKTIPLSKIKKLGRLGILVNLT